MSEQHSNMAEAKKSLPTSNHVILLKQLLTANKFIFSRSYVHVVHDALHNCGTIPGQYMHVLLSEGRDLIIISHDKGEKNPVYVDDNVAKITGGPHCNNSRPLPYVHG